MMYNLDNPNNPFFVYDNSDDWIRRLFFAGWKVNYENSREIGFTRPHKEKGNSAVFYKKVRFLWIYTTNAPPFQEGTFYKPYSIFCELECFGDYKLARRRLLEMGYGKEEKPKNGTDKFKLNHNGFISFKTKFILKNGELNLEVIEVEYPNIALYSLYLEDCRRNNITTKMTNKEFTSLIRNAFGGKYGITAI